MLNNHLKHKTAFNVFAAPGDPDVFSSDRYFDGWVGRRPEVEAGSEDAVVVKGGRKLSCGWKRQYRALGLGAMPSSNGVG